MKEKTRDGRRNSGRKSLPAAEKKIQVPVYIPAGIVEAVGGKAEAQRIATEAIMKTGDALPPNV